MSHARHAARSIPDRHPSRWFTAVGSVAAGSMVLMFGVLSGPSSATASEAPVGLGTVKSYSVLGGQTVTNTGPTTLQRNLGVSPGTAITGFPPGQVGGDVHAGDAHALQAQADLVIAYDDAAGRAPTALVSGDLVGQTLTTGVYKSTGPLALSGTLTLDAQGDPGAMFIFQIASTWITASSSTVSVINGAQSCNVFWQVGSSATLGTTSQFVGTLMALTSISVQTSTVVKGRALARNGQVSLDNNVFTTPGCEGPTTPPTTSSPPPTTSNVPPTTTTTSPPPTTSNVPPTTTTPPTTSPPPTTTNIPPTTSNVPPTTTAPPTTSPPPTTTNIPPTTTNIPPTTTNIPPTTTNIPPTTTNIPPTTTNIPPTTTSLPPTSNIPSTSNAPTTTLGPTTTSASTSNVPTTTGPTLPPTGGGGAGQLALLGFLTLLGGGAIVVAARRLKDTA